MNKKKTSRIIFVLPVVVALIVVAVIVTLLLSTGSGRSTAQTTEVAEAENAVAGPTCEFAFIVGLSEEAAVKNIESIGRPFRVIKPNSAVTQDYRPDRINLMVNDNGIVQSVDCN